MRSGTPSSAVPVYSEIGLQLLGVRWPNGNPARLETLANNLTGIGHQLEQSSHDLRRAERSATAWWVSEGKDFMVLKSQKVTRRVQDTSHTPVAVAKLLRTFAGQLGSAQRSIALLSHQAEEAHRAEQKHANALQAELSETTPDHDTVARHTRRVQNATSALEALRLQAQKEIGEFEHHDKMTARAIFAAPVPGGHKSHGTVGDARLRPNSYGLSFTTAKPKLEGSTKTVAAQGENAPAAATRRTPSSATESHNRSRYTKVHDEPLQKGTLIFKDRGNASVLGNDRLIAQEALARPSDGWKYRLGSLSVVPTIFRLPNRSHRRFLWRDNQVAGTN